MILLSHYTETPFTFDPTREYDQTIMKPFKPSGLWLSDDLNGGWAEWCKNERWGFERLEYRTDFRLRPDANIIHLKGVDDIREFNKTYGNNLGYGLTNIDWETVVADFDGILLSPYSRYYDLNYLWHSMWDCSSGCFWNLDILEQV